MEATRSYSDLFVSRQILTGVMLDRLGSESLPKRITMSIGLVVLLCLPAMGLVQTTTTSLSITVDGGAAGPPPRGNVATLKATVLTTGSPATPVTRGLVKFCKVTATFCSGIHVMGVAQLTSAGTATLRFVPEIGNHSYKAAFIGTTTHTSSSSGPVVLTVTGLYPTAATIGRPNYLPVASVGGNGSAPPTGMVSFLDVTNGNSVLATATLAPNASGLILFNSSNPAMQIAYYDDSYAVNDYNNDGFPDLAMAFGGQVFLGNGDGTFTPLATFLPNGGGSAIETGDFNQDGNADLVVIRGEEFPTVTSHLNVLLGNGDGTFRDAAGMTIVNEYVISFALAVADFNGDGLADVAARASNVLAVLLGKGDGTFSPAARITNPTGNMIIDDFNNDGVPDMAFGGGTLLLGRGDGTFESSTTPLPTEEKNFATGDFNGDGILDLVLASMNTNVSVLLGNGNGTFHTVATTVNGGPTTPSIEVADFNGDGLADVALVNSYNGLTYGDGIVSVCLGDGTGNLTLSFTSRTQHAAGTPRSADLNGDGAADLIVAVATAHGADPKAVVLLSEAQSAATPETALTLTPGSGTHQVVASYAGDSNYLASTSPVAVILNAEKGTPTVGLNASSNSATYGTSVTLIAAVSGAGLTPSGWVRFYGDDVELGSAALDSNGIAALPKSGFAVGEHSITATYLGDDNYVQAFSAVLTLTVDRGKPSVQLAASSNPVRVGTQVTFSVTLIGGGTAPTGTITFLDGATVLGTGTLNRGATAYSTSNLALGTHRIYVRYEGDTSYNAASSVIEVDVLNALGVAPSSVSVTPSAITITNLQSVDLNLAVVGSSGQGIPAGLVAIAVGSFSGQQRLQNGTASAAIPSEAFTSGNNVVIIRYLGDELYAGSSATAMVTVSRVAIAVTEQAPISAGESTTAAATLTADNEYSGTMKLTCSLTSSPGGAQSLPTCSVNPAQATLAPGGVQTAVVTVTTTRRTNTSAGHAFVWKSNSGFLAIICALFLVVPSRRRRRRIILGLLTIAVTLGSTACGGGGKNAVAPNSPPSATTTGNYLFTLTGTDAANASITTSTRFTIVVN